MPTTLNCLKCNNPLDVEMPNESTVSAFCTCGFRANLYRLGNVWETETARRKRLANYRVCGCGKEYQMADHRTHIYIAEIKNVCPECAKPLIAARIAQHSARVSRSKKGNRASKTPWRTRLY